MTTIEVEVSNPAQAFELKCTLAGWGPGQMRRAFIEEHGEPIKCKEGYADPRNLYELGGRPPESIPPNLLISPSGCAMLTGLMSISPIDYCENGFIFPGSPKRTLLYKRLYLRERIRQDKEEAQALRHSLMLCLRAIKHGSKDSVDEGLLVKLRELHEVIAANQASLAEIESELFPRDPMAEKRRARDEADDAARLARAMEVGEELKEMPAYDNSGLGGLRIDDDL